jgi:hypothetical protein
MVHAPRQQDIYCELVAKAAGFWGNKVTISVDFGQAKRWWQKGADPLADPKTGQSITFNSVVDALNHMSSQGWSFVQAFVVSEGKEHVYHHLMRKTVESQGI